MRQSSLSKDREETQELAERIRELECLYGISALVERGGIPFEDLIDGILDLIRSAWQYPETTCVRITLGGHEHKTDNFAVTPWKQARDIFVSGRRAGELEVYYLEERPDRDEGPFLIWERKLLNAIGERLGRIAERIQTERELLENKRLLDATGRMARVGGWELYAETLEVRWTEETYRIHEMPMDYKPFLQEAIDFFHPEDRERLMQAVQRALNAGEPYDMEVRFITARGKHLWTRTICSPLVVNGKTVKLVGVFQDITERKLAELALDAAREAAEAASRAKSTFLANMSHEVRMPLAGILGMTEMLLSMNPESEQKDCLEMIKQAGGALTGIIGDILDLSQIEAGRISIVQEEFDLQSLVDNVVGLFSTEARRKGIELSGHLASQVPRLVMSDPLRLRQVLSNLVGNALKFTDRGHVKIGVEPAEKWAGEAAGSTRPFKLLFSVRDTGIGIPENARATLFNAFTQGDSSYTKKYRGTGLGLAISGQLVERMGGEIWFESTEGEGSEFFFTTVFHPAGQAPARTEEGPEAAAPPDGEQTGPLRILLAEDEIIIQKTVTHVLEKAGHEVVVVANGREVLEALHHRPFDLILMDVQMPEMDGLEATHRIRSSTPESFDPDIPVIALTAYAMKGDRERMLDAGMDDYISKPARSEDLSRVIQRVLTARRDGKGRRPRSQTARASIDMAGLMAEYQGNEELLDELIKAFLDTIPERRDVLRLALEENDAALVKKTAHNLAGLTATFMASGAARYARQLLDAAGKGDFEEARSIHGKLESELGHVIDDLSRTAIESDRRPPAGKDAPPTESPAAKPVEGPKARILVVEDEPLMATRLENSLKNLNYDVCAAVPSGEEAVRKAAEDIPDLVLMDILLAGEMDGIEAAELIRSRTSVPVVFLTGHADDKLLERARTTLPHGYLLKPVKDRELKAAIEVALYIAGVDSERKRAEEERETMRTQLLQSQKLEAVGRLAGGVAHDFNNMLGIILGRTELILDEIRPSASLHHDVMEIRKAAQRSADLTRQLLAFARKQTISPRILDLNETASGILKMLRRLIGEDIRLVWKPRLDVRPVKMDPGQIDQILANLAVNARDAMAGAGTLTIETSNVVIDEAWCLTHKGLTPGRYVLLAVSDTGSGMDKETLENIFEPFFTTKEVGKGTGLGLATVYGIVKQNNGYIDVSSEPGEGTTFKIYLPGAEEMNATKPAAALNKDLKGTETVLLVEDEESILALGKTILQRRGYVCLATHSPFEALRMAQDHVGPVHLLITDVMMPAMSGKELRDRLAEVKPGFKCIFISGYTADVIGHYGVLDEGIHFLEKPFSVNSLAEKVREVLDASSVERGCICKEGVEH